MAAVPTVIEDFSAQWRRYPGEQTPVATEDYLADILGDTLALDDLNGRDVADLGAGVGRFTGILSRRARSLLSVEPSDEGMRVNRARPAGPNVQYVKSPIAALSHTEAVDIALCIGVLHHVDDMDAAVRAVRRLLRPGGVFVCWVYGAEGTRAYRAAVTPLRVVTPHLPDVVVEGMSHLAASVTLRYASLARRFGWLPMAGYARGVAGRLAHRDVEQVIFDQLNPRIARYLSRPQLEAMFARAGFTGLRLHHRHGYSWTVRAERPQ